MNAEEPNGTASCEALNRDRDRRAQMDMKRAEEIAEAKRAKRRQRIAAGGRHFERRFGRIVEVKSSGGGPARTRANHAADIELGSFATLAGRADSCEDLDSLVKAAALASMSSKTRRKFDAAVVARRAALTS